MAQQENRVLTIAAKDALVTSPVTGMSDFSSWGATSELTLKPELSAPGGNIYSAIPGNQYELMSGTSMASPHVAGGMAIVKGAVEDRFLASQTESRKTWWIPCSCVRQPSSMMGTRRFPPEAGRGTHGYQCRSRDAGVHHRGRHGAAQAGAEG